MRVYSDLLMILRNGITTGTVEYYDGPVALAGGGGTQVTNETVPTGPYAPQIPFILGLFNEAANLYNQGAPQAFPGVDGQLTPGINPNLANTQEAVGGLAGGNIDQNQFIQQLLQQFATTAGPGAQVGGGLVPGIQQGIGAQLGAENNPLSQFAQQQVGGAGGAFNTVFDQTPQTVDATGTQGGAANVNPALGTQLAGGGGQNPYLDSLVQGAVQSQLDQFQRNILPSIRSEAGQVGQPGGTRQGIAEGIATSDLNQQIGNTVSNIYGNAFNTQAGLQGQAVGNVLNAQQGDQSAQLQASGLTNQAYQQYIQSLLQGTGQVGSILGQGTGLGLDAVGSGTAQAGNLFNSGNALQLQQQLGALGLVPGFQAGSLAQLGAVNQLGLQQYGLGQADIDALANQYYFNQNSPFNLLSQYQQYISGPYGSTVGQFQPPSRPAPIGQQPQPGFGPNPGSAQTLPVNPGQSPDNTTQPLRF